MKKNVKLLTTTLVITALLVGCGQSATEETSATQETQQQQTQQATEAVETTDETVPTGPVDLTGTQKAVVEADDYGPVVTKTILSLNYSVDASSVKPEDFTVSEEREYYVDFETFATDVVEFEREILDVYTSDENGKKTDSDSKYLTIEMYVSPNDGTPFIYKLENGRNTWSDPYTLTVSLADDTTLTSGGNQVTSLEIPAKIDIEGDGKICAVLDSWDITGSFTASNGEVFSYASYTPAKDDSTNPLVIWFHGGGECGTDPQISLLGNKVTALSGDEFQELLGGAYVLVPQCPPDHHWCNGTEGDVIDDVETYGNGTSIYIDSVFELIENYVAENSDINPDKILIGGCSAGGYMTMAMLFTHPDYFAAAFPISEAYYSQYVTDEEIERIKDCSIWFTNAKNDTINPDLATNALIERLEAAGASDIHHSEFEDVHDTSGRFTEEDGSAYQYNGHWSWIYFDNNECEENGVNEWEWLASKVQ